MTPDPGDPGGRGADRTGDDPHPDLVALVRHELSNAAALDAGDHLSTCDECRDDLPEVVVGAAVMGRAARTLAAAPEHGGSSTSDPDHLPPLELPAGRRTSSRDRWLLTAAAVVVAAALGALTAGLVGGGEDTPTITAEPPAEGRTVVLAPPEADPTSTTAPPGPDATGRVRISEGDGATTLTFTTDGLPAAGSEEYYEAWLLDPATEKMLPLGLVPRDSEATFEVATSLVEQYGALDLSLETDDGDPTHSATSVLRGAY